MPYFSGQIIKFVEVPRQSQRTFFPTSMGHFESEFVSPNIQISSLGSRYILINCFKTAVKTTAKKVPDHLSCVASGVVMLYCERLLWRNTISHSSKNSFRPNPINEIWISGIFLSLLHFAKAFTHVFATNIETSILERYYGRKYKRKIGLPSNQFTVWG